MSTSDAIEFRDAPSWVQQTVQSIVELTDVRCEAALAKQLSSEAGYLTPSDWDDFGQAVLLEILVCIGADGALDELALKRLFHRVRQRILRQTRHEQTHDPTILETASAIRHSPSAEFEMLESLSGEDIVLFDMVSGGADVKEIARELRLSEGTIYRRLRLIRTKLVHEDA